jgi:pimeloyl-ACP methyl ester carboxylesterase
MLVYFIYTVMLCRSHSFNVQNYSISSNICNENSTTVEVLVHGITYNKNYWDFSQPDYSWVKDSTAYGHTTIAIDRLGIGNSSHPVSSDVTLQSNVNVLVDILSSLRPYYKNVVYVGHSYGSFIGQNLIVNHTALADYYIFTGIFVNTVESLFSSSVYPVLYSSLEPANIFRPEFKNLDDGYLVIKDVDSRKTLFYNDGNYNKNILYKDFNTSQTCTSTELSSLAKINFGNKQFNGDKILHVVGEYDKLICPNGHCETKMLSLPCTDSNTLNQNCYWNSSKSMETIIIPNSGHDINLHYQYKMMYKSIIKFFKCHKI